MGKLLTIIICVLSLHIRAQQKDFVIIGNMAGSQTFKYAYAFDNEHKLIKRANVVNGAFLIEGAYQLEQRFGELAIATILLSNNDGNIDDILADNALSNRKYGICSVILEKKVFLKYNTDDKTFQIDGEELNKIQNKFVGIYNVYRNRRDSAYASINKINTNDEEAKLAEARKLFREAVNEMIKLVIKYPDSEVSLFNFSPIIFDQLTYANIVEDTFNHFSNRLKNSEYGTLIKKNVDDKISQERQMDNPVYTVGMKLPDFELLNSNNKLTKSKSIFGKYTLVDFWATWCVPCRKEIPNLILAHNKFKMKGFKVVAISIDDKSERKKWLDVIVNDKMIGFINLFNGSDEADLARKLKIASIPTNFLVDDTGRIISINLYGTALVEKLKELKP